MSDVDLLAAPPVTIGELTDVPAPGSPVASPWAQEVTRRAVHRFPDAATRDAKYPAATAGVGAVCTVAGTLYTSNGTVWVGKLRVIGTVLAPSGPGAGGGIIPGQTGQIVMCRATVPIPGTARLDLTALLSSAGPWSAYLYVFVGGVQAFFMAATSGSNDTIDLHPFVTIPAAGTIVEIRGAYGSTGTGTWTWFVDSTNFQFTVECGQF